MTQAYDFGTHYLMSNTWPFDIFVAMSAVSGKSEVSGALIMFPKHEASGTG
jgi:hypothetical protein